jgi:CopG family nickel-responsive transcriptional regulator
VKEEGFLNRSQAIAQMVRNELLDHQRKNETQVMAGTLTLVYDESVPKLRERLIDIQRSNIDSVISTQHVLLENNFSLEVWLVQAPVQTLRRILSSVVACKGVETGKLTMTTAIMPPIHRKGETQS